MRNLKKDTKRGAHSTLHGYDGWEYDTGGYCSPCAGGGGPGVWKECVADGPITCIVGTRVCECI